MIHKIEIAIDVIIHATEDISKILQSFDEVLEIKEEEFTAIETTGYFENPIIILSAKLVKKQGQNFIKNMLDLLPINQINEFIKLISIFRIFKNKSIVTWKVSFESFGFN